MKTDNILYYDESIKLLVCCMWSFNHIYHISSIRCCIASRFAKCLLFEEKVIGYQLKLGK